MSFNVVDNTTATITLTLTNPGTTSEKICYAHFAYNQDENIPADNKVKLLSAKIQHTNSSETDLTNDFYKDTKFCNFNAKTPVEWSSGDNFVVTLQVNNTTGASTSHTIQAAQLKTGTPYGLIVNGITVTNVNQNSVTNKTKYFNEQQHNVDEAVFTPEVGSNPATLTLTQAYFDVSSASIAAIESSLGSLKVILAGENEIKCGNNKAFNLADNSSLTITTNGTNSGQLTITSTSSITTESFYSPSTATVTYTGLVASNPNSTSVLISPPTSYDITIAGVAVTNANASAITGTGISGTVSYDATTNTLTLTDAGITSDYNALTYSGNTLLTIALNGTNSITATSGTYTIDTTGGGDIKFVKATGASTAPELTISSGNGSQYVFNGTNPSLGSGLYWKPMAGNQMVITEDPEFIIIDNLIMTDNRTVSGDNSAGTITYSSSNKTLTIDGFQKNFGSHHAIKTGVSGLKVKLIGASTINCSADSAVFYAFCNSASIQFIKNDETSKLTMTGKAFDKFVADNVTYDGLVYYSTNKYIAIPTAPTMDVDIDNKVVLTADYEGGTIAFKYSIDYADETADVTDATYSAPFEMAAPGTVTAWVEANGTTTSTVKGKKFGYQGAPFSMMVNDVKTPVLIPAIEAGDDIVYDSSTPYASNDASVATFENGNITAHAIGTATLTTRLGYNTNNVPATKLLNYDGQFTTQLTVSKVFNIAFAEGANYMTYYNIDAEDLTIPDGMTAAIVTGVASSGTTVETTALSYIPGRTAILLGKGTSTGTPSVTKYIGKDPAPTGNKLKYVEITPQTTTGYEYVLYKDEFVKATGSIPDGKCYLDLTGVAAPAPARSLGIDSDGTTDIHLVNSEEGIVNSEVWYDLQGRRIQQPTKAGLYIKNGKKVIVNTK